jgi:hypothetical protein
MTRWYFRGLRRKGRLARPTVVIGGILSSTFLTLVLLPVLYAWFEKSRESKVQVETAPPSA